MAQDAAACGRAGQEHQGPQQHCRRIGGGLRACSSHRSRGGHGTGSCTGPGRFVPRLWSRPWQFPHRRQHRQPRRQRRAGTAGPWPRRPPPPPPPAAEEARLPRQPARESADCRSGWRVGRADGRPGHLPGTAAQEDGRSRQRLPGESPAARFFLRFASGGQRVDTNDGAPTGSSMVYSPSQLDAADDVDPVAEADVYLAYGRDLQAEEILKEACAPTPAVSRSTRSCSTSTPSGATSQPSRTWPTRPTRWSVGKSPEWAKICEQGQSIDPNNPLYQPGGQPSPQNLVPTAVPRDFPSLAAASAATQKIDGRPPLRALAPATVDLDLDLDFSLDDEPAPSAIVEAQPTRSEPTTVALKAVPSGPATAGHGLRHHHRGPAGPAPASADTAPCRSRSTCRTRPGRQRHRGPVRQRERGFPQQAEVSFGSTSPVPLQAQTTAMAPFASVDAPLPDLNFGATTPDTLTATQAPLNQPDAPDSGMLEFDLGTLSLELEPAAPAAAPEAASRAGRPAGNQAGPGGGVRLDRRRRWCPRTDRRSHCRGHRRPQGQGAARAEQPGLTSNLPALGSGRLVRLALGVSYHGAAYQGWQSQPSGQTVQDQSGACTEPAGGRPHRNLSAPAAPMPVCTR
jgi:hypothetical protein